MLLIANFIQSCETGSLQDSVNFEKGFCKWWVLNMGCGGIVTMKTTKVQSNRISTEKEEKVFKVHVRISHLSVSTLSCFDSPRICISSCTLLFGKVVWLCCIFLGIRASSTHLKLRIRFIFADSSHHHKADLSKFFVFLDSKHLCLDVSNLS